ncbi:bacillithiol biosynthesis deacetylase BshB2 [Paenibacillus hemerocallicola]|jgi:bacillithiol biosynthesis deacetylase BshB2|uniref:Bacillithiol biosynthesis deacetylase BshB2 n=1 Tax=Paenibacillus hemerocallicola TaxID=1172614 RepID=A0A5C4T5L0_9BACL|nr:bacillithiol biosynthesis deacetylase BshB2 [Paenibacillus hemerocallicola]TNJ64116.1 bacillithiol biosynthesis deacetylase BshB2 [Paenibacillus hemerocallicola]
MERQRHVLVILPHPDDETALSGTVALHIRQGTPVTYVCLTLGEMGRNMGVPPIANRVTLPAIRKLELEESCRVIGIQDLRQWGLHDKTVEFENRDALIGRIEAVIAELSPSLILTFYPGYSVHPDHDACGSAVIGAVEKMPASARPEVHCVAFAVGCEEILGQPDIVNDVSELLDLKLRSLEAHQSQFRHMSSILSLEDEKLRSRWGKERFWTYRFD